MSSIPGCPGEGKKTEMIRVLQGNMHRSRVADDLLSQLSQEKEADVLLLSEQYKNKETNWYSDQTGTSAIWIANPRKIQVVSSGSGLGHVWVKTHKCTLISCYLTPNQTVHEYKTMLDDIEDTTSNTQGHVILAGDFNAKAAEWGMTLTDQRGRQILDMAARTNLIVLNRGNVTTFRRPGYTETIPDISLSSESLYNSVIDWKVMEDYTGSDHQYISFQIKSPQRQVRENCQGHVRWNAEKLDQYKMAAILRNDMDGSMLAGSHLSGKRKAEAVVDAVMKTIRKACEESMPRKIRYNKRPVYWWTDEIAGQRTRCLHLRRLAQRSINRPEQEAALRDYKVARKILRKSIKKSKADKWKSLCNEVNLDPWGLGYKIVMKRLHASSAGVELPTDVMESIVATLFPTHQMRPSIFNGSEQMEEIPEFSQAELEIAVRSLKNKKAAGPDGIPGEAIKSAAAACPQMMLHMYNTCLREGVFSKRWKEARLVLIDKGKGERLTASAYRPLCILDVAGKLMEKLMKTRLHGAIQSNGGLSNMQYGFRPGRSTLDAILNVTRTVKTAESRSHYSRKIVLLVTLDVKNAFNSANWRGIIRALQNFNIPGYLLRMFDDYLDDRCLCYNTESGRKKTKVTAGVAQGSILGPDLWNIFYDSLLQVDMPEDTFLAGYADDAAVIISARNMDIAQIKLNQVMRRVNTWMEVHGLELATSKTEIVILTKKRIPTIISMEVGGETVQTKLAAKYLGVTLDVRLSFWQHIKNVANRAAVATNNLSRLMANTGGPSPSKRRLLMTVIHSILLYGSEIWADALNRAYCRKHIVAVQRRGALRVACSYRTVSEVAVLVIANVIPIDLLAQERKSIHSRAQGVTKKDAVTEARSHSMEIWQNIWTNSQKGRWTARLIPQLSCWMERKHGEVNFYITQFLSGHGYFRSYLYRMGKVSTPYCIHCRTIEDTPHHTFFECSMVDQQRRSLVMEVGPIDADCIVGIMLRNEEAWNLVAKFVEEVLRQKKQLNHLED